MDKHNHSYVCCFLGHRKVVQTEELKTTLRSIVEDLIVNSSVNIFLFGSKSEFDDLCHKIVTELKQKYSNIKRVYVRSNYADINESYKEYLLESYDETYYPEKVRGAGKASYVKRNQEMIDKSDVCVVYYMENYTPPQKRSGGKVLTNYQPKSGTKIAYEYAISKHAKIINVANVKNNT